MASTAIEKIVLASGNAGKIREIAGIFSGLNIEIVAQSILGLESPEETGSTFVENALLKARYAAEHSGLPAMADDSGIVVDALNGRPGVRSARYAGENATDEENLDLLLEELKAVPDSERGGGFHCAAVWCFPAIPGNHSSWRRFGAGRFCANAGGVAASVTTRSFLTPTRRRQVQK